VIRKFCDQNYKFEKIQLATNAVLKKILFWPHSAADSQSDLHGIFYENAKSDRNKDKVDKNVK